MPLPTPITLRQVNNLLTAVIVLFATYLLLLPFIPSFAWWVQHQAPVISKPPTVSAISAGPTKPVSNTLQIPAIGLSETVHEGAGKSTLRQGVWHRPGTSSPDKGGNTVLAGHRFTYKDPAVFYHLDKVRVGDTMTLVWNQKTYTYRIKQLLTVPPTATYIEQPTAEPTLTVYTCTPLWSSTSRLVLVGALQEQS